MRGELMQSASGSAFLRLDPRTKLLIVVIISIMMMSGKTSGFAYYPRIVLGLVPLILLLTGRRIMPAAVYAVFIGTGVGMEMVWQHTVSGTAGILVTMVSGLITRFVPCVVMGYYLMASTQVSEFIAAMERMHVPMNITIPLSVMFRFFPTVLEEARAIHDAMRMRGISWRSMGSNPVVLLEYRLVPLMMSVVKIGDELSASALTRGLGGPVRRTNVCRIGFGGWDLLFGGITLGAAVLYKLL